jgi:hypothetical protein
LATSIRRNPKIVGISLPNRNGPDIETKVNMFADDTQLINKTSQIFQNTNLSIILVSNLKEISPSIFSWKKKENKNYDAILSKYDSAERR